METGTKPPGPVGHAPSPLLSPYFVLLGSFFLQKYSRTPQNARRVHFFLASSYHVNSDAFVRERVIRLPLHRYVALEMLGRSRRERGRGGGGGSCWETSARPTIPGALKTLKTLHPSKNGTSPVAQGRHEERLPRSEGGTRSNRLKPEVHRGGGEGDGKGGLRDGLRVLDIEVHTDGFLAVGPREAGNWHRSCLGANLGKWAPNTWEVNTQGFGLGPPSTPPTRPRGLPSYAPQPPPSSQAGVFHRTQSLVRWTRQGHACGLYTEARTTATHSKQSQVRCTTIQVPACTPLPHAHALHMLVSNSRGAVGHAAHWEQRPQKQQQEQRQRQKYKDHNGPPAVTDTAMESTREEEDGAPYHSSTQSCPS